MGKFKGLASIIVVVVIITIVGIAGYFVLNKQSVSPAFSPVPTPTPALTSKPTSTPIGFKHFKDQVLGIEFDYPEAWGTAKVASAFTPLARINKEITFSGNNKVILSFPALTPESQAWYRLDFPSVVSNADELELNRLAQTVAIYQFYTPAGYNDAHNTAYDVDKKSATDVCKFLRGDKGVGFYYDFGDCSLKNYIFPFVANTYTVDKSSTKITFISFFLIQLHSDLFPIGILYFNPGIEIETNTKDYCLIHPYGTSASTNPCNKNTSIVQKAWQDSLANDTGKEITNFQKSVSISTPLTEEVYSTYLGKTKLYKSIKFPVQFSFPEKLGVPSEGISSGDKNISIDLPGITIDVTSHDDALRLDNATKECEKQEAQEESGPGGSSCGTSDNLERWEHDKNLLVSAKIGDDCSVDRYNMCKIQFFKQKAIVTYVNGQYLLQKKYVYYFGNYRYDVQFFNAESSGVGPTLDGYMALEKSGDIGLQTLNSIAESIDFTQ